MEECGSTLGKNTSGGNDGIFAERLLGSIVAQYSKDRRHNDRCILRLL